MKLWKFVVAGLLAAAFALPVASPVALGGEDLTGLLDCVDVGNRLAIPVTEVRTGNGGSWYQLFQDPASGFVYVSWSMSTNNINNGADEWAFGIELEPVVFDGQLIQPNQIWELDSGYCKLVGFAEQEKSWTYYIDAGAAGWSGVTSCTSTYSWEMEVGVQVTLTGGFSVTGTLGESLSCSDGIVYDSESLIRSEGSANLVCPACLPDPARELKMDETN